MSTISEDPPKSREVAVYRSAKKADTYLYLPVEDDLESLPRELASLAKRALPWHSDEPTSSSAAGALRRQATGFPAQT